MAKVPTADLTAYLDRRQAASPYTSKEQAANSLVKHFGIKQARANDVAATWWPTRTQPTPPPPSPPPPTATFIRSPAVPVNPPVAVNFDASGSTGNGLTYEWFHGTAKFADGVRASFTYQSVGAKTVTLRVTDAAGQTASITQSFMVDAVDPTPAPTPTPTPTPTPGAVFHDDASNPDPIAMYGAWAGARADGAKNVMTYKLSEVAPGHLVHHTTGGSNGGPYRQFHSTPGADPWSSNARDALGLNRNDSPVALYHEGDRRRTHIRLRIPTLNGGSGPDVAGWCELFEIKQSQPYPGGMSADDGVMFELQQNHGKLQWMWHWSTMWELDAVANHWYDLVIDGLYTRDASKAWLDLTVDGTTRHFTGRPTLLGTDTGGTITSYLEFGPYLGGGPYGFDVELVEVIKAG